VSGILSQRKKLGRKSSGNVERCPSFFLIRDNYMEIFQNLCFTIHRYIDHTQLKPDATSQDIVRLCTDALNYEFAAVAVNSHHVKKCASLLKDSPTAVCCAIGFPLGANASSVKFAETAGAISDGAGEVDMVINIGELKAHNEDFVEDEIRGVVEIARPYKVLVKVILETCLLTDEEKTRACLAARRAGADFVKTSTGFGSAGATEANVRLMAQAVEGALRVKASGGIYTWEAAQKMVAAGAARLGTSAGVAIVEAARLQRS
jgi:deoxyribose-phosphate aldolase